MIKTKELQHKYPLNPFGILGLLFNAATFGLLWYPLRLLHNAGIHSIWVTTIISAVGTITMWIYSKSWRDTMIAGLVSRRIHWQAFYRWLPLGFTFGATSICFGWGMLVGQVAKVILLFYLMPLWVIPCAWILLREKPAPKNLITAAMTLIGAMFILYHPELGFPLPNALGEWLGLAGGISFAANNVLLRKLANQPKELVIANNYAISLLFLLLFSLTVTGTGAITFPAFNHISANLILLVIACISVFAHIALVYAAAITPVYITPIILISEVIWASVSAALLADETLTLAAITGAGIIIAAAIIAAIQPLQQHSP